MSDLISRQAAIDALRYAQHRFTVADEAGGIGTVKWSEDVIYFAAAKNVLADLPSAEPESCDMCDFCNGLESGDKLFQISDWDGGIGFDYIYIRYCPMCGRKL